MLAPASDKDFRMHRRLLLGCLMAAQAWALVPATAAAAAATESPRDIVTKIYKISAGKDGKYQGPSAFSDKAVRGRYFSKSLLAAVVRMEKRSKEKDEVILSSAQVPKPVAARYAWANDPQCSLYNQAGLPAPPFRTDDWQVPTQGEIRRNTPKLW